MVRRLRLAPGEVMPWHRDPFHRTGRYTGAASRAVCANSNEEDNNRTRVAGADRRGHEEDRVPPNQALLGEALREGLSAIRIAPAQRHESACARSHGVDPQDHEEPPR